MSPILVLSKVSKPVPTKEEPGKSSYPVTSLSKAPRGGSHRQQLRREVCPMWEWLHSIWASESPWAVSWGPSDRKPDFSRGCIVYNSLYRWLRHPTWHRLSWPNRCLLNSRASLPPWELCLLRPLLPCSVSCTQWLRWFIYSHGRKRS